MMQLLQSRHTPVSYDLGGDLVRTCGPWCCTLRYAGLFVWIHVNRCDSASTSCAYMACAARRREASLLAGSGLAACARVGGPAGQREEPSSRSNRPLAGGSRVGRGCPRCSALRPILLLDRLPRTTLLLGARTWAMIAAYSLQSAC